MDNQSQKNLVKDALLYYDSAQERVQKLLDKIHYVRFEETNSEIKNNSKIIFFDKNKNKLLTSAMEYMAIYIPTTKTLKWAWSVPSFAKTHTELSRKLLNYAFNLEVENEMSLKSDLLNSKIKIQNDYQFDIQMAIASYLTKKTFIFKYYNVIVSDIDYLPVKCERDCDNYIITYIYVMDFA